MRFSFLLTFLFIFLWNFFIPNETYAQEEATILLNSNVTGRIELQNGEKVKYVTLYSDIYYSATSSNKDEWAVKVGNAEITVPKRLTKSMPETFLHELPKDKMDVITTQTTFVFSQPSTISQAIASFPKYTRISTNGSLGGYYEVVIGGQKGYIHKSNVEKDNGVPILIYHHLVKNQNTSIFKNNTSVYDIALFEEQMNYLNKAGFTTISLEDLDLWMKKKQSLPGKSVVLTFDDANLSVGKLVYPILKKNNMQATTFVIGNRVKKEKQTFDMFTFQFANFNELRKIKDVFNLEYHTYAYHEFNSKTGRSILQDASVLDVLLDFERSKQLIKSIDTTSNPRYFAYPYGKFNIEHEEAFIQSGVSLAFLNKGGKATTNSPRLYVPRIPVQAQMTLEQFKQSVNN